MADTSDFRDRANRVAEDYNEARKNIDTDDFVADLDSIVEDLEQEVSELEDLKGEIEGLKNGIEDGDSEVDEI